jgi:hypothetical protein
VPLSERCLKAPGGPPIFPTDGSPYLQIIQTADHLALWQDGHSVRVVPVAAALPRSEIRPMWQGNPRGRWHGDTLIVETVGFRDQRRQRTPFMRFDENLHVVERFSMTAADGLWYEFTVTDPTVFSRPWTGPCGR